MRYRESETGVPGQRYRAVSGECPVCGEDMHITRMECDSCHTVLEGHFLHRVWKLTEDQQAFLEAFLRNRGTIKDVEAELGISYPTVKARLESLVKTLGLDEPAPPPAPTRLREERRAILDRLQRREITATEAHRLLSELTEGSTP